MKLTEYQTRANETALYREKITDPAGRMAYAMAGLSEEAGEVNGKWKRVLREHGGIISDEMREKIIEELGDVLWYVQAIATELGSSMDRIAEVNLEKLSSRKTRGVLHGTGDSR